jgi:pteridine reductase
MSSCVGGTALITGASKRIGRHIALACADCGMNVIVHYRRSRLDALRLVSEIKEKNVGAWALAGDFSAPADSSALIGRALALCGKSLSLLVNNASMFPHNSLSGVTFSSLTTNIRVNAWAPLCLSRAFAKKVRCGSIVNLLDARIAGRDKTHVAYILSKHMLAALTKICALEFAPGVRVNAVAPGLIFPPAGETGAYLNRLKKTVPLKRHGTPDDVASAVLFLAGSRFITGETIFVDGGKHLLQYQPSL